MIDFRFGTAFRNNLTDEEEAALDHLLDMMTAVKQQILLRRAMKEESNVYRLKDQEEARMSIYKKEIAKYQTLLDKLTCGFDTLTFDSVEEKNMLAELLKQKVDTLRQTDAYCDYWHSQKDTDWEDPRL